jgi:hypothetical protein
MGTSKFASNLIKRTPHIFRLERGQTMIRSPASVAAKSLVPQKIISSLQNHWLLEKSLAARKIIIPPKI